jgi:hypothetical protein
MGTHLPTRRAWAFNAWLTALLLAGIAVVANRLAEQRLRLSADLSEERLFAPSPVAERLLGSLQDVLQVKAFFTGEVKHGSVQLAKSRLLDQLHEVEDAARGRIELVFADPNTSSEVRLEAERYGIQPVPLRAVQGTSELTQEVFLGLLLRYRGREAVLPFVLPQSFQYGFLSELAGLLREDHPAVGLIAGDGGPEELEDFADARKLLAARYQVRALAGLADGEPVPADVRLVVVARPHDLHPRAAFALDQHVQRGGRLLILAQRARVDLGANAVRRVETGLEPLFDAFGAPVDERLVFDQDANWLSIRAWAARSIPSGSTWAKGGWSARCPSPAGSPAPTSSGRTPSASGRCRGSPARRSSGARSARGWSRRRRRCRPGAQSSTRAAWSCSPPSPAGRATSRSRSPAASPRPSPRARPRRATR